MVRPIKANRVETEWRIQVKMPPASLRKPVPNSIIMRMNGMKKNRPPITNIGMAAYPIR